MSNNIPKVHRFGLFGPALAEIILIFRTHDQERWRDYWQRVFDIRRISKKWLIDLWLILPTINVLAILLVAIGMPVARHLSHKSSVRY